MIGYTILGTNDLQRATRFYDELFGIIGNKLNAFCMV
jgi:catechol 2,3-dioxygenase-like lactoylglutathione lyase family enzyme